VIPLLLHHLQGEHHARREMRFGGDAGLLSVGLMGASGAVGKGGCTCPARGGAGAVTRGAGEAGRKAARPGVAAGPAGALVACFFAQDRFDVGKLERQLRLPARSQIAGGLVEQLDRADNLLHRQLRGLRVHCRTLLGRDIQQWVAADF